MKLDGESYKGKLAVGHVVLNRVKSKKFPNTICGVILAPGAFSNFRLGKHKPSADSIKAANEIFKTKDPTNGALFFASSRLRHKGLTIGNHTFRHTFK